MSRKIRRLTLATLAAAPLVGGLVATAPAAHAATPSGCPANYLCVWRLRDYADLRGQWATTISNLSNYPRPGCAQSTWNDCAQSAYNNSSSTAFLYVDANFNNAPGFYDDRLDPGDAENLPAVLAGRLTSFYLA